MYGRREDSAGSARMLATVTMNVPLRRAASFALVAAGFSAGVAQVLLLRELLTIAYGNELSMGVLLACWLVCGALGALVARRATRADASAESLAKSMVGWSIVAGMLMMIALVCARSGLVMFYATPWADGESANPLLSLLGNGLELRPGEALSVVHMAVVGLLAALGPAALNGVQFALGCKLYERAEGASDRLGVAYASDAIGHLLGGVVLASVVVLAMNPFWIAGIAGGVNWLAAVALLAVGIRRKIVGWAIAVLLAGALTVHLALFMGERNERLLGGRAPGQEVLASVESIYGNLMLTRQNPDGIYLYQSGVYSGASPPLVGTIDQFVHFAMLQHPEPQRVLMIGGGVFGGLAEVLKHGPERIDYVELDDELFALAREWASDEDVAALNDPRVRAMQGDGRRLINQATSGSGGERWDVILLCLPDPSTAQLNRFYTVDFYARAREALSPTGVLAWEIPGSDGYFGPALLRLHTCLRATAASVFDEMVVMPGESAACVASTSTELSDDWKELEARLQERGVQAGYFEALLPDLLDPWTLQSVRETLAVAPDAPLNRDMRPVGYFLDQAWWATQFHPRSARWFGLVEGMRAWQLLIPGALAGAVLLALSGLRGVRSSFVPLSVAVTGLAAMSIELALLFAFQAMYGYVYHMVGVIVGAFMVGLAAGSVLTSRWLSGREPARVRLAMAVTQTKLAVFALVIGGVLPWLWATSDWWAQSPWAALVVFPLLTAMVGAVVGVQFPLATAAWHGADGGARAAAGLYAADLLGGAVGALAGGALLAPVLGLPGTCHLAAGLSFTVAVLLFARAWRERTG